jgi:hypothetical protein
MSPAPKSPNNPQPPTKVIQNPPATSVAQALRNSQRVVDQAVGSEELARQRLDAYRQRLGQEWATQ